MWNNKVKLGGLGFSIQHCDARLWVGKKQICFLSVADQSVCSSSNDKLYLNRAVQKEIPLYERQDGEKMREGANYFWKREAYYLTFWCLICTSFAPLYWLNWKEFSEEFLLRVLLLWFPPMRLFFSPPEVPFKNYMLKRAEKQHACCGKNVWVFHAF